MVNDFMSTFNSKIVAYNSQKVKQEFEGRVMNEWETIRKAIMNSLYQQEIDNLNQDHTTTDPLLAKMQKPLFL